MAVAHPALLPAAGLPSGLAHVAHDRWDPVKESNDYSERFSERRIKNQIPLPIPALTPAYTNEDIEFSHPTNRPLLACNGLPRNFKIGSRCINPLEPRYVLPGCASLQPSPSGAPQALPSPNAHAATSGALLTQGTSNDPPHSFSATLPSPRRGASPRRSGSERLLLPAMSLPRASSEALGAAPSPKLLQPLQHSQSLSHSVSVPAPLPTPFTTNVQQHINGAVGGLLLYGPTAGAPAGPAAAAAAPGAATVTFVGGGPAPAGAPSGGAAASRNLDVSDINGPRRSTSVPLKRHGAFDPLHVADIVPPRKVSPTRPLNSLANGDIRGATPKARTRDVPSPGAGTLNSADISGASPACLTRPSPTTYALGRWPPPAVPQYQFTHSTRVTMLKKPITIGE